jgi:hypothetical protein
LLFKETERLIFSLRAIIMPDRNEEPLSKINRRCAERPMPHNTTDFLGNPIGSWPAATERLSRVAVKRFMREAIALRHLGAVPVALLQGHLAVRGKYYENIREYLN